MWERGWLSEPLIDRIRGELYVRRIVASSWSERDLTVGIRVCFFSGKVAGAIPDAERCQCSIWVVT